MKLSSLKIGATTIVAANEAGTLLDFIKEQTNIDLTKLVHKKQTHPRKYLAVDMKYDWNEPSKDFQTLLNLEKKHKDFFTIEPNGGLGIALVYGPKLKS